MHAVAEVPSFASVAERHLDDVHGYLVYLTRDRGIAEDLTAETFERASRANTSKAQQISDTMAFMFETRAVIRPTRFALESAQLQHEYFRCWEGLSKNFTPDQR